MIEVAPMTPSLVRCLPLGIAAAIVGGPSPAAAQEAKGPPLALKGPSAPHLVTEAGRTGLYVGGRPLLMLAGELGNSAASTVASVRPVFPRLAALGLNTVLVPVSWELVEPEEGKFRFDLVTGIVREARRHQLRLVLLWFGSWKNSMSSYVPAWVKADQKRFPRAEIKGGRGVEALSAFAPANQEADSRAFAALMRHLRQIDRREQTVVMVQVENEVGMLEEPADQSAAARAAFNGPVPKELVEWLTARKGRLEPALGSAWQSNGSKTSGSWEQLFGKGSATEELFMAWHLARYVDAVTRAGKAVYPLPMFVNAALNRPGRLPGQYPSGGPLPHLYDIWKAGAPTVDFLAPDIYLPSFVEWSDAYARPGNPLFVPEAKNDPDAAAHAFYSVGRGALGFSPFAIETAPEATTAALSRAYRLLGAIAPALQKSHLGSEGVLLHKERSTAKVKLGDYVLVFSHDYTFEWASAARLEPTWPRAGGLAIALAPDEFLIAGNGVIVTFAPAASGEPMAGLERVDEGEYQNGKFVVTRRLNGDETHQGRHVRIPMGTTGLQRVKLYRYR